MWKTVKRAETIKLTLGIVQQNKAYGYLRRDFFSVENIHLYIYLFIFTIFDFLESLDSYWKAI